jgi:methylthioxylose transferase
VLGRVRRPPYAATAAFLVLSIAVSKLLPAATKRFPSDLPPSFVQWDPLIGWRIAVPLVLTAGAVVALPRLLRLHRRAFLAGLVAFTWIFAVGLAVEGGHARSFAGCCEPGGAAAAITEPLTRSTDYLVDVPLVDRLGPRVFAQRFPQLDGAFDHQLSLRASTHPPGPPLFLWALSELTSGNVVVIALLVVLIGALGVIPTYLLAVEAYGEATARLAAVLFGCSPMVLLYSATSIDAVFMTAAAVAMAALVRAPRSDGWAVTAGLLTMVALCFTWASLALGVVALGVFVLALPLRPASRLSEAAIWAVSRRAGLFLLGLAIGAVLVKRMLGIDLLASYYPAVHMQRVFLSFERPYRYWMAGNVVAFLIAVGIGHTALVFSETWSRLRSHRFSLETVLWAVLIASSVAGMIRGEVEHIWLLFVPLASAVAGAGVVRLRESSSTGRTALSGVAIAGLGQALLTEALLFTNW